MKDLLERFLEYTRINTQSNDSSETVPSTAGQWDLAKLLKQQLEEMGLVNVDLDEHCYLMAELPSNMEEEIPVIGFVCHLDTAPDTAGENVKAQVLENYDGGPIALTGRENTWLDPRDFSELLRYKGQTLITTDGTTLLGADDKAGIAILLSALEYLCEHPEIRHGKIKIAFTPDEEIARGADHFDVNKFGADFAFTLDGGELGEMETENFNAARADIVVNGMDVHPGTAKNQMRNAINLAMEFHNMLPSHERPEHSEGHEGFFHLLNFSGSVSRAEMHYLIRDHHHDKFEHKKKLMQECADLINMKYHRDAVELKIKDQYYNMKEVIEKHPYIIDIAIRSIAAAGVKALRVPVRGGTDGARLSFMGLPCPNLFTGGHNYHGIYEYIPLESMKKSRKTVLNIIELGKSLRLDH